MDPGIVERSGAKLIYGVISVGVSFIRTVIIFFLLILSLRIMGKRQLGELEPIELVVAVLISNLASQPLQDIGTPLLYGIVPVLTLLSCQLLMSGLTFKSPLIRKITCGKPSILISEGQIVQSEMRKNRISLDELYVELRSIQVTDIESVRYAILETNGTLSVLLYKREEPATAGQMNIPVQENGLPVTLISDGVIQKENLVLRQKSRAWLERELRRHGIKSVSQVYIMTLDSENNVFLERTEGTE